MKYADARTVAQYILGRRQAVEDALTPMQLIKLTYIAQGYMLGKHGRPLFNEPVEAWQYGPVVPSVYHAVKNFRSAPVTSVPFVGPAHDFTGLEHEIMDFVADSYGPIDGIVLSTATHQTGTPWEKTWSKFGKNAQISNDLIENFYVNLLKQESHSSL